MRPLFGTDGIRGLVGKGPLANLQSIGYAIGTFLREKKDCPHVIVGHDTRQSCEFVEENLCGGLRQAGIYIESIGMAPTPAVSFITQKVHADLGIVISASHNSYEYNGIKIFNAKGEKISREDEKCIEKAMSHTMDQKFLFRPQTHDYLSFYEDFLVTLIPSLEGLQVVLDCAHGAFTGLAARVLRRCGAIILHEIGTEPDGKNINDQVGSLYPMALRQAVLDLKADLGIAFDGDGDRLLLVCDRGQVLDGDQIIACLAKREMRDPYGCHGIVGTSMSGFGLEKFLQKQKIPFVRTDVGDRYIAEMLRQLCWNLGAEPCGHIVIRSLLPTGDGLMSALLVAHEVKTYGNPFPLFRAVPFVIKNIPFISPSVLQFPKVQEYVRNAEIPLQGCGRIFLRFSGTEDLLRVLVEGPSQELVCHIANQLVQYFQSMKQPQSAFG